MRGSPAPSRATSHALDFLKPQISPFSEVAFVIEGDRATRRGGMTGFPAPHEASPSLAKVSFHEPAERYWPIESLELPEASQSWEVPAEVAELPDALENVGRLLAWSPVDG